jgi:hypothetical protein
MENRFQKGMVRILVLYALSAHLVFAEENASKKEEDKIPVAFGGFVDTYYAYDFNNPSNHDRAFTTQPARHNEFNVNLAYVDAKLNAERFRGRFALQAGTSVQSNYAAEPTVGSVSGPSLSRHIQEAVIGYRVTDKLWIDAGIYLSHIGFESWISKENWTYTRSLMADFSPYYQSGVKATYQWADTFSTQLHVLNGWQNISENNGNKALGFQAAYAPSDRLSLTYNNFFGNEVGTQSRFFNDFIAKVGITDTLQIAAAYDVGLQQNPGGDSSSVWQTYGVFVRYQFTPKFSLTVRGEQYFDKNQVIVVTGTPNGFQTTGASLTADVALHKQVLWRNEVRGFWSKDSVYPTKTGLATNDGFVVTSLSLWF